MKSANVLRTQIAVALVSFISLVAVGAPTDLGDDTQSFIGTTPNATVVEAQPATF